MNNKKQQNTFISGMMLDSHPSTASDTMLTNCLNGTLITYGDNQYVLQNDLGNGKIYSDKEKQNPAQLPHELFFNQETESKYSLCENLYRPVGMKEHNGILYIVSQNIKSKLYYQYKEDPTINKWTKADTVTLSVSNTCKYIINIEVNVPNNSSLSTQKVGYLKHYNDQGEEVDSTELTVEQFLLRIKDDINKIDFQEIRHLDDEDSIVYKGSEIGSFPSPQYERINGVISTPIQYTEEEPEKTYNCDLYSEGYKLEDQSLAFGDYLRLEVEDNKKEDEVQLQDVTELNSELKDNIPNVQKELFNLDVLLSLDNVSTNITSSPDLIHQSKENQTKENSYIIPQSQEGQLQLIFNESELYSVNSDDIIFYYNGDTDPVIYATGSIDVIYNAPDGNGKVETNDFNFKLHSSTEHRTKSDIINYLAIKEKDQKFNLIKTDVEVKDNELDSYSGSKIVELNDSYYINREITLKQHPIIRIENLSDIEDIECKFWLLGNTKINKTDKIAESLEYKFSKIIPVDRIIKDAISLFQFNYDFSKEPNTFNYSITLIEPKLPYTNLKLYFDFVPITMTEVTGEKVITALILELNESDRLGTFRVFKDSIVVENLEGSYAVVFYAEVDGIISYIDTQYYINYSDYTNLNYLLFRQDIYDSSKNTGRIINYYIDNIKYVPSAEEPGYLGWEGIYINNITINNKDYTYNYYIADEIEEKNTIKIQGFLECSALSGDRTQRLPVIYEEGSDIVNKRFRNSAISLLNPAITSNLVGTEEYTAEPESISDKTAYKITINDPKYKVNQIKVRDESFYRFIKSTDIITVSLEILCKKDHDRYNRFKFRANYLNSTRILFSDRESDSSGYIDLTQWCKEKTCPLYTSGSSVTSLSINYNAILSELHKKGFPNNNIVLNISFDRGNTAPTYSYVSNRNVYLSHLKNPNAEMVDTTQPIYTTFIKNKYVVRENKNENWTNKKYLSFYNTSLETKITREVSDFIKIETGDYKSVITKIQNDIKNNPRYNIGQKDISYITSDFIKSKCLNQEIKQEFFIEYNITINPDYTGIVDYFYDSEYSKNIYSYIQYDYSDGNYETLINYIKLKPIESTNKLLLYFRGKLYSLTTQSGSLLTRYTISGNELTEPSTKKMKGLRLIRNIIDGGHGSSSSEGGQVNYGSTIYLDDYYFLDSKNTYQYVFNLALNI